MGAACTCKELTALRVVHLCFPSATHGATEYSTGVARTSWGSGAIWAGPHSFKGLFEG